MTENDFFRRLRLRVHAPATKAGSVPVADLALSRRDELRHRLGSRVEELLSAFETPPDDDVWPPFSKVVAPIEFAESPFWLSG